MVSNILLNRRCRRKITLFSGICIVSVLTGAVGCDPATSLQTGKAVDDDIVVSLDNPDFTEMNLLLTPAATKWNGVMPRTIDVAQGGFSVGNGDFRLFTWRGDGPALSNGVSTFAAVSGEDLPARPDELGHYASDQAPNKVSLQVQGLRIGYSPMLVRLFQIEPDRSMPAYFATSRVRLDANVALVPIEAVVVFDGKDGQGRLNKSMEQQRLTQQLALWDHLPVVQTSNITDGQFGELTSVIHTMPWYGRDKEGYYRVGTQTAPDMVWARCGVQFRLVNYFELQVPPRNVYPVRSNAEGDWPFGTNDDAPLRENVALAKQDPRHMEGTITVIFMLRASFADAPEVGRALPENGAIGVSLLDNRGTDGVIAHELGHLSGLRDARGTEKDASGNLLYNVMIGTGPGIVPTKAECDKIKRWGDGFKKFWTKFHRPGEP